MIKIISWIHLSGMIFENIYGFIFDYFDKLYMITFLSNSIFLDYIQR